MNQASPSVWIAGASGLVGHALVQLLSQQAVPVHALVRRRQDLPAGPQLQQHLVDFGRADLGTDLPAPQTVYIALGTTMAQAGSQQAFRAVDLDAVVQVARAAKSRGARSCAVVSALGADVGSRVFYNRVKGEMEQALAGLGFDHLVIVRPSLLLGDRTALGQRERPGERWGLRLTRPVLGLIPKRWRPVPAQQVARAMVNALAHDGPTLRVIESDAIQDQR